ncbi:NTP/NDP exchange transporter [Candidatus Latescibacterota bacterium]
MDQAQPKSFLERFLSLFSEVRSGEGITALLLFFNLFILMTSYYIMKPVREALILSGGGAEVKSYAAAGQAILLLGAVPLYGLLAGRLNRKTLINTVTVFFTLCLGLFYLLAQLNVPLGVLFYLWLGIFNLMVPAQFWAFSNDLYTPKAGKRIFVIIAFGANTGAILGTIITEMLIQPLGIYQLLLVAGALLILNLLITNFIITREKQAGPASKDEGEATTEEPIGKEGSFQLVFSSKYLLAIAFLMLFLNWVNTTGEYILGKTVLNAATEAVAGGRAGGLTVEQYIGTFYAGFFRIVNVATLLIQLFVVSRILKYLGTRIAILFLPIIALFGYGILAFSPVIAIAIVQWAKTAENATDYSLQNTVRQILFLPTSRAQKYKAKQAIDSFFVRAGDVLSAILVYAGTVWFAFQVKHFALVNLVLVFVWLTLAYIIGRQNQNMVSREDLR